MGVPGFFSWLIKQYKGDKLLLDQLPEKPSILYIDANCLFHPQCFKILEGMTSEKRIDKLEEKMINRILNYIDYLIGFTDPQELVYLSVDGVAPLAKINQQRKRRFRSIDDTNMRNAIKKKYNIESNDTWNNTVITPGTEFMEKLHKNILDHFRNKKSGVKIIYSSYHTPGEGEHKILQHLKNKKKKKGPYVIYGLDADLFFLAMSSQVNDIYLLREDSQITGINKSVNELYDLVEDVAEELKFVSVDTTKSCYNEQIKYIINMKMEQKKYETISNNIDINKNFCNDFIFLCYLLGNDFLPHFPSIDIKKNGLDILLDSYSDIYIKYGENLININNEEPEINDYIFYELIKKISSLENDYFTRILPEMKNRSKNRRCMSDNKYVQEMWKLENMKIFDIEDPIKLGHGEEGEWKFRYYEHYFHTNEYQNITINEVCECYLVGLKWVTYYYFKECPDWRWQYYYNHAPFISDLYYYLDNKFSFKNIKFKMNDPLECCTQLLCVLPPKCKNILPLEFQNLVSCKESAIIDMFPDQIELDMINKDLYWQCIPLVPVLDIDRILACVKNIKLKKEDKIRNMLSKDIIIN